VAGNFGTEKRPQLLAGLQYCGLRGPAKVHALRGLRSLAHGFVSLESSGAPKHAVNPNDGFGRLVESFLAVVEKMAAQSRAKRTAGVRT
jgi:hypothetical protein